MLDKLGQKLCSNKKVKDNREVMHNIRSVDSKSRSKKKKSIEKDHVKPKDKKSGSQIRLS